MGSAPRPVLRSGAKTRFSEVYQYVLPRKARQRGPLNPTLTTEEQTACLAVPPEITAEVRNLARRIAPSPDPQQRIAQVVKYLQTHHHYSLKVQIGEGDPVCDFLLHRRDGHCQYFASAAVILLRCVGVPSRFVSGYYAHEPAGKDTLVVRQRDAHAWAECWTDATGWITVDATPDAGLPGQSFAPLPTWRTAWEKLQDAFGDFRRWLATLNWVSLALGSGEIAATVGLLRWAWQRLRHPPSDKVRSYACPDDALQDLALRFERLLKLRNLPCEPQRTWQENLADTPANDLRDFVQRYNVLRFGTHCDKPAVNELHQMLVRLEQGKETPT